MKLILKTTLCVICLFLFVTISPRVFAWFSVSKIARFTLVDITQTYWFDLLYWSDTAPELLSEAELEDSLPTDYVSSVYSETMNGYQDVDGYRSIRLYRESDYDVIEDLPGVFVFNHYATGAFSFKLALIYADGTIECSSILTQTKPYAEVTYAASLAQMEEFDQIPFNLFALDSHDSPYRIYLIVLKALLGIVATIALELLVLFLFGYRKKKIVVSYGIYHAAELILFLGIFYLGTLSRVQLMPYIILIWFPFLIVLEMLIFTKNAPKPLLFRILGFVLIVNVISIISLILLQYIQ